MPEAKKHPLVFVSAGFTLLAAIAVLSAGGAEPAAKAPTGAGAPVDFVRDVQPIFAQHCYKCHDAGARKGGLQLDIKQRALAGGDSGPILTAGDPEKSKLI